MKNKILLFLLCIPFIGTTQNSHVPDNNFEQALINLGYDTVLDDSVYTSNIDTLTHLDISLSSIQDLTGIEDFTDLKVLRCNNNQLTNLDMSANTALDSLFCQYNQIINIDVSQNIALTGLDCGGNQLININVSQNINLVNFGCYSNQLTSLDLGANANLDFLWCFNNPQLYCIDVYDVAYSNTNWTIVDSHISWWNSFSNNCSITTEWGCTDPLAFNYNALATINYGCDYGMTYVPDDSFEQALIDQGIDNDTSLNDSVSTANIMFLYYLNVSNSNIYDLTGIENFNNLIDLDCDGNQLTTLDLNNNLALTNLNCDGNQLTNLNVTNNT